MAGDASDDLFDVTGVKLKNLPRSREEVIAAGEAIGKRSILLLDEKATETAFKSQPLADFQIIHLAVHGVASVTFPDRAALVLESDPASHEDGLLQVREIRNLPLNADLVILSACDTGQGRLLGEEGIANLEQAFLLAGANTVIASLWGADDTYTLALMKQFYRHLALGQDKDSALRRAQIDLLAYLGNTQFRSTGRASLWWATGPGVSRLPTASRQDTKISETMNEFLERRGPIEDCHHCAKT